MAEVWIKQINENTGIGSHKLLVASKSDLATERTVTEAEGRSLAETFGMSYWEVSAKEDLNIKEMFLQLTEKIVSGLAPRRVPDYSKETILQFDIEVKKKKKCC
jgi:GTPase SAR1 family protein